MDVDGDGEGVFEFVEGVFGGLDGGELGGVEE